jgi:hypothetical protein
MDRPVAQREDVADDLTPQGEAALVRVGVQQHDLQPRPGDHVGEHPGHRGDPDPGAGEDDGSAGVIEHDIAERQRHGDHVTNVDVVVEQRGHLAG